MFKPVRGLYSPQKGGQCVCNDNYISTVLLLDNKTVLVKTEGRTGKYKIYAPGIEMEAYPHISNNPNFCDECKRINYMVLTNYDDRYESAEFKHWWDLFLRHDPQTHITQQKSVHKGNGVHQGLWAGTLTMSPTDPYNEEDMIGAIKKIFAQQTVPVKNWAWYREYTKNGTPHIHFVYETDTGGRIHKKIFQRYWKLWDEPRNQTGRGGFPGGYHSPAKSETAYLEYISKDGGRRGHKGFKVENEILQVDK